MTETAPERIWASPTNGRPHGSWNDTSVDAAIEAEYVRADQLDEAVKALEKLERICANRQPDKMPDGVQICRATLAKIRSKTDAAS